MSNLKFTPGPWRHEDGGVIHAGVNDHIAVMKGMPEWEANAALIAAAPELYECLAEAVKIHCNGRDCEYYINGDCTKEDGLCAAQEWIKILKKARGES